MSGMQLKNLRDSHIACCICKVSQQNTSTQVLLQWLEAQLFEVIVECVRSVLSEEYVRLCHQTTCTSQGLHHSMQTSSIEQYTMPAIDSHDIPNSDGPVIARVIRRWCLASPTTQDTSYKLL